MKRFKRRRSGYVRWRDWHHNDTQRVAGKRSPHVWRGRHTVDSA